ncbi:MAG: hypothetical protein ABIG61_11725 [Planctomycetota bacterium]
MAKKKKSKDKTGRIIFSSRREKKKHSKSSRSSPATAVVLKTLGVICVCAAIAAAMVYLKSYIAQRTGISGNRGTLVLLNIPEWAGDELLAKVRARAAADGEDFLLDEDVAWSVSENLRTLAWLKNVRVRTKAQKIEVNAEFRRPLCWISTDKKKFYLDEDLVVLDGVAMPKANIIELKGLTAAIIPPVGQIWRRDDLNAAVKIIKLLENMDRQIPPSSPLLFEIADIDVSNYGGRRNADHPHILLHAKDGTEIRWGAEIGSSARYMEASDNEKLEMLYGVYKDHKTIQGLFRYIELRVPRIRVPHPEDSY